MATFSLRSLIVAVTWAAVVVASFMLPPFYLFTSCVFLAATLFLFAVATGTVCTRGVHRAFYVGATIFGFGTYLLGLLSLTGSHPLDGVTVLMSWFAESFLGGVPHEHLLLGLAYAVFLNAGIGGMWGRHLYRTHAGSDFQAVR